MRGNEQPQPLAANIAKFRPEYDEAFFNRCNSGPPLDPLKFHLCHLARNWSRLTVFCHDYPSEACVESCLGAAVAIGFEYAEKGVKALGPVSKRWLDCRRQLRAVLYRRPVAKEDVEKAKQAITNFLAEMGYDPWQRDLDPP